MTNDGVVDEGQARLALDAADRARESARRVGRQWARRYLLGFGAASAGSLIFVWILSPWVSQAWWGLWYAGLVVLFATWLRRQPVKAVPKLLLVPLIAVWAVIFGTAMAIAIDFPAAYPIGALAGFATWAAGAWWVGR